MNDPVICLYCTFPVRILEYVSRNFQLCISELLGITPLPISNSSNIFLETIYSVVTFIFIYGLYGLVVKRRLLIRMTWAQHQVSSTKNLSLCCEH
jgi:hypothetical protein